jgi:hypothetical protein
MEQDMDQEIEDANRVLLVKIDKAIFVPKLASMSSVEQNKALMRQYIEEA